MERQKYFYTVLFLDDYYISDKVTQLAKEQTIIEKTQLKKMKIYAYGHDTQNVKWIDQETLSVNTGLKLPVTLQMWDNHNQSIFYAPVVKDSKNTISINEIAVSGDLILFHFTADNPPPEQDQTYALSVRTLPAFDTESLRDASYASNVGKTLDQMIEDQKPDGLAIVFRRNSLDSLFDLIEDFDESYWHSLASGRDLQYLTKKTLFKKCCFTCKYTSELQDVLDLIDITKYQIKYSWNQN